MNIEHDDEWLDGDDLSSSRAEFAKAYHQHMRDQEGERVASTIYQAFGSIDPDVLPDGEWERVMDWLSEMSCNGTKDELLSVKSTPEHMQKLMAS